MTSDIKTTRGARAALREVSGVAGRLLTRKTMAKALVLFREVDIKGKVVDKNTREALTRWISCRVLTIAVAESFDTCTKVNNYDKHWYRTTLWFR